jgi:hypothetical protein
MVGSRGAVPLASGGDKLLYHKPVYYCNGHCNGTRIRHNTDFYTGVSAGHGHDDIDDDDDLVRTLQKMR